MTAGARTVGNASSASTYRSDVVAAHPNLATVMDVMITACEVDADIGKGCSNSGWCPWDEGCVTVGKTL